MREFGNPAAAVRDVLAGGAAKNSGGRGTKKHCGFCKAIGKSGVGHRRTNCPFRLSRKAEMAADKALNRKGLKSKTKPAPFASPAASAADDKVADGEAADGCEAVGNAADGQTAAKEAAAGGAAVADGKDADGEAADVDGKDADGEAADVDGKAADGEAADVKGGKSHLKWPSKVAAKVVGDEATLAAESADAEAAKEAAENVRPRFRLTSTAANDAKRVQGWVDGVRDLKSRMGKTISVAGDGFCWMYAILASMNVLQTPSAPTKRDYELVQRFLEALQEYCADGMAPPSVRSDPDKLDRIAAATAPPFDDLDEANYGGASYWFPVIASFLDVYVVCITAPVLGTTDEDARRIAAT